MNAVMTITNQWKHKIQVRYEILAILDQRHGYTL